MKFLITGVAGLLGSRMAEWLLENTDHNIIGIDDLSGGLLENLPRESSRFKFYQQNIVDNKATDKIFEETKPDYVYHFAAYAPECVSSFMRCFNYENNIVATVSIINACIKYNIKRLVFTSSMAIYGEGNPPFEENAPYSPIDPYGIAKMACEYDITVAGKQHNLDWCIIRPHNLYGKNQNIWDPYRNFIAISMYKGLVGDPITIYGDGKQKRAFSEVSDILYPLYNAAISKNASKEIINLGGINEYTIEYVANVVSKLVGVETIYLPPRFEVKNVFASYNKSMNILGFEHKTSLEQGILEMWEWAKRQPKRERFIWNEYEIENGLYPQWRKEALKDGYYKNK